MTPTTLDVYAARRRLGNRLPPTPLRQSAWLSDRANANVFVKLDAVNLTGSFKIRGAFNAVLALLEQGDAHPLIVAASAGNHGRAIALACEQLGLRAAVFTPRDAPEAKKSGIRRHGAELFDDHDDYDIAEQRARVFAAAEGGVYISPYNHRDVIAGAGTVALEIIEALPNCDVVVIPLGGGGLASGIGLALKAVAPQLELVGVEVEASTPFTNSLKAGHIVVIDPQPSLADGLTGNLEPGAMTFALVAQSIARVVVVNEFDLRDAMRAIGESEHLIVEGAGATAAAAVSSGKLDVSGKTVAVLVTGGNVDLAKWLRAVER